MKLLFYNPPHILQKTYSDDIPCAWTQDESISCVYLQRHLLSMNTQSLLVYRLEQSSFLSLSMNSTLVFYTHTHMICTFVLVGS